MFTTGSKLLIGASFLAWVAAIVLRASVRTAAVGTAAAPTLPK